MVDQHTQPVPGTGAELGHDGRQVVHTAHVLDHDADVAQVVAPDLLDQLGVVSALDVDPAGQRDLGGLGRADPRPGAGVGGVGAPARRRLQRHRLPLEQEARAERERPAPALAVLQDHQAVLPAHHGAAEPAGGILDHQPGPHHLVTGGRRPPAPLGSGGQHVGGVSARGHGQRLCRGTDTARPRHPAVIGRRSGSPGSQSMTATNLSSVSSLASTL
ncbi:hypothetical protein SDC9_69464 [bioreactor metagenome]|uniref:Uncharacterized protein n=1 Tax=bioreactor metagenome TaxID=1076179 RepID=A0A644Y375_9ZZZZ